MDIPSSVKSKIIFVAKYIGTTTNNWLVIKRHLINAFNSNDRNLFSARHPCTKKQVVNEFDKMVMEFWKETTGVEVYLDPDKIHDPNWIHKPRGWRLRQINDERRNKRKQSS